MLMNFIKNMTIILMFINKNKKIKTILKFKIILLMFFFNA